MQINVQAADWACCESAAWTGPNSSAWTIRFPSWAEHSTQCSGAILCTCIHRQLYFCHFHCCQVSTKLHGQFEKKNSAKYRKKGCIVNYFVNTKFTTQKVDFLSKLPMKKLKMQNFRPPGNSDHFACYPPPFCFPRQLCCSLPLKLKYPLDQN